MDKIVDCSISILTLKIQKLTEHYLQLLGFSAIWKVDDVNLSVSGLKIEVHLRIVGDEVFCPQCGERRKAYDKAPERRWRHLDTMQFETIIIACIPRCQRETCGVKTTAVPSSSSRQAETAHYSGSPAQTGSEKHSEPSLPRIP